MYYIYYVDDVPVSNNSDSNLGSGAIIGGAVGGAVLFLIIIALICIVILCMRRSSASPINDKAFTNTAKLSTNANIENNSAYDVSKVTNTEDYVCIKPEDSDVPITANPSYGVPTNLCRKESEDEYNYVQPNEFIQHPGLEGTIKIDTNPSYGVHTAKSSQLSNEREYGVVNQPIARCNDTDYEITHDIITSQQTDTNYM